MHDFLRCFGSGSWFQRPAEPLRCILTARRSFLGALGATLRALGCSYKLMESSQRPSRPSLPPRPPPPPGILLSSPEALPGLPPGPPPPTRLQGNHARKDLPCDNEITSHYLVISTLQATTLKKLSVESADFASARLVSFRTPSTY